MKAGIEAGRGTVVMALGAFEQHGAHSAAAKAPVSGGGALAERATAQFRLLNRRDVGLVEGADVGSGRDDLIDPVEDIVGKDDVHPARRSSSCCMVRAPSSALVTPGCETANAIARWGIDSPASSASGISRSTVSRRRSSLNTVRKFPRVTSLSWPRRTRPVSMP